MSKFISILTSRLAGSRLLTVGVFALLALLMIATRPYHFASVLTLPSASLAVFFICGLLRSSHRMFAAFFVLSVLIDLASSYARGAFGDCITPSYPFLVVGYYVMWWAGLKSFNLTQAMTVTDWTRQYAQSLLMLWLASSIAFLTSNGSYYWLSGKFAELSVAQYAERVVQYYVPYVQSPFVYVIFAMMTATGCYYLLPTWQRREQSDE
ncbi:hypothetical protein N480_21670 [Pseudoalteromonas luteoviolacea S2607]|uniref:hypothetical protein n=1 Tax=Pseudoalteromonas luteoviolacea TaxID=43657 RepID=UPI0007B16E8D|nr:hypothetical protein [Pseudoalteromonas luteoviolacea]KZN34215.1 hypothetical protein N480_21670 [Pseudoalteromonas luteoviolacea S2607]